MNHREQDIVLYIEDNPDNMRLVKRVTEKMGYECIAAETGQKGVKMAISHPFRLIMIDIQLPDIDGYEVIKQIRSANVQTPLLVITADVIQFNAKRAASLGCQHFLTKPIRINTLIDKINSIV
ncbi:MAG: response regulator [Chloroflexota bacterium]